MIVENIGWRGLLAFAMIQTGKLQIPGIIPVNIITGNDKVRGGCL